MTAKLSGPAQRYATHRAAVIARATVFRVHAFHGGSRWETAERSTMAAARRAAEGLHAAQPGGRGCLIYAVAGPLAELVETYDAARGFVEVTL